MLTGMLVKRLILFFHLLKIRLLAILSQKPWQMFSVLCHFAHFSQGSFLLESIYIQIFWVNYVAIKPCWSRFGFKTALYMNQSLDDKTSFTRFKSDWMATSSSVCFRRLASNLRGPITHLSQRMTKPTIRLMRPAKTQISLRIRAVW